MSKKSQIVSTEHGLLIDTINYERLIQMDSSVHVKDGSYVSNLNETHTKEVSRPKVYIKGKTERSTQKDIYCGKRK